MGFQLRRFYKASEVKATGEAVTTVSNYGGLGFGYLMPDGEVYSSGGNGFFYPTKDGVTGLREFKRDGGQEYQNQARRILAGAR